MIIENVLFVCMMISLGFGLAGWIVHFYTLIRSYFSDTKWTVTVQFNYYHEAISEIIVFASILIFISTIIIMVFVS